MAPKWLMFTRTMLLLMLALTAAAQNGFIVRVAPGQVGKITSQYGLTQAVQIQGPTPNLYVMTAPPTANLNSILTALSHAPGVQWVELDQHITLPKKNNIFNNPSSGRFAQTQDWANLLSPFGWAGYLTQPAGTAISLAGGHQYATGMGVVAFLDTGVDFANRELAFNLIPGADFTSTTPGVGQEQAGLNQSTTSILDSDSMIELNQSTTSILDFSSGGGSPQVDQSTTSILDQSTTSILDNGATIANAYGHGTMVAGLIHLVAPTARLMPVKVFGNDGTSQLSTILSGIYYAIGHGAKVINMSFSMMAPSTELQTALQAANSAGIICVAAVGNEGQQILVYPAGYSQQVIGVASTNNQGLRSSFSNYGPIAALAAPGEEVISTYPGNRYAAGWGTSFSTPLVSGAVALLLQLNPQLNQQTAAKALSQADSLNGQGLGAGELDLVKALQSVKNTGWGWGHYD